MKKEDMHAVMTSLTRSIGHLTVQALFT